MTGARIRELDGLRGVAAAGVAFYHIHPHGTFWMWSFVDLFFVLSGYLITGILLRLERWDRANLRNFWVRRILRIWPVYYLALLAVLLLWFAWQYRHGQAFGRFSGFRESLVFLPYIVGDYADLPPGTNYLWWFGHSWSLAVEEQFYLVWPLALGWMLRAGWRRSVIVAVVALGICAVAGHANARGALPAWAQAAGRWLPYVAFASALALLAPYFHLGYSGGGHPTGSEGDHLPFLFAVAYASLVAIVLRGRLAPLNRVLGTRLLVRLGGLSYAIYMFHLPIQKLLDQFYNAGALGPRPLVEVLFWVLVLGSAALCRVLVERPMERLKSRFPLRFARQRGDG